MYTSSAAPLYVDLPGTATYPQPYNMLEAVARVYLLEAKAAVLQASVDQWLNSPNVAINDVYDYVALPWVAMVTMPIGKVSSIQGTGYFSGYSEETDVAFAVLLAAYRNEMVDHFAVGFPFVLVDNPVTMVTGREVFGYRKALGTYEFFPGNDTPMPMPIAASTPVMTSLDADAKLVLKEVMRIDGLIDDLAEAQGHGIEADIERMLAEGLEKGENFFERVVDKFVEKAATTIDRHDGVAQDLMRELVETLKQFARINCAFLAQLRDCGRCDVATYQAVIESPINILKIKSAQSIGRPKITLSDYPTYPIVSNLGIIHDGSFRVQPKVAMQIAMDFQLLDGRVIVEGARPLLTA
jgi:hypothetical protein